MNALRLPIVSVCVASLVIASTNYESVRTPSPAEASHPYPLFPGTWTARLRHSTELGYHYHSWGLRHTKSKDLVFALPAPPLRYAFNFSVEPGLQETLR